MKFICTGDDGEPVAIEADTVEEAARELAERLYASDPSDSYAMSVVNELGVHFEVTVDVEVEVSFYAHVVLRPLKKRRARR